MLPVSQSAYRQFHSTETAVLKVYNDLLLAADSGQVSALCLLDLTAAFDIVLSVSLVSAVSFFSGSVHICLTGPLELFLAATVHLLSCSFALLCSARFTHVYHVHG